MYTRDTEGLRNWNWLERWLLSKFIVSRVVRLAIIITPCLFYTEE